MTASETLTYLADAIAQGTPLLDALESAGLLHIHDTTR